jgi:hypothetical protein
MQKEEFEIIKKHTRGCQPDHLFTSDGRTQYSRDFLIRAALADDEFVAKFGRDKPTRNQVCDRMAGSALVSYSLGYAIESIRVWKHQTHNVGTVDVTGVVATNNMGLMLFREAAGTIGGYAAAEFLGGAHPHSSIPNRLVAAIICRYMEVSLGKPEWHFFQRTLDYCQSLLCINRAPFEKLSQQLRDRGKVSQKEAMRTLKSVCSVPVDGFLYA